MHIAPNETSFAQAGTKPHFRQDGSTPTEVCRTANIDCVGAMLNRGPPHATGSQIRLSSSAT